MKGQANILNISGAAASVALILASYFVPSPSRLSKLFSKVTPQTVCQPEPEISTTETSTIETTNNITETKISTRSVKSPYQIAFEKFNQRQIEEEKTEETPKTDPLTEETEPQPEPAQTQIETPSFSEPLLEDKPLPPLEEKSQPEGSPQPLEEPNVPSTSNGCPKNLEYYTMKPRPKSPPEECLACDNLISCVCQTSN